MMKKLFAMLLALMLLLGLTAFAEEEAYDYTGLWVLTGVSASGVTVDPTAVCLDMTMELYEDGTCTLVALGEEEAGAWVQIEGGVAVTDADAMTMNLLLNEEGALTVEQDGAMMIFTQESYAMPLSGLTAADFNGSWEFVYADVSGQIVEAAALGEEIYITLQDGAGHVDFVSEEGTTAIDAVCEIEEVAELGTVMYFLYLDETGAQTGAGLPLLLYDDGELVWVYSDEENIIYYCFVRAEELAE